MNILDRYEVIDTLHPLVPTTWKINATAKDEIDVRAVDHQSGETVHQWTINSVTDLQQKQPDIVSTGEIWSRERREL